MKQLLSGKRAAVLVVILCLLITAPVFGQEGEGELQIRLRKDFGFNAGLKIQGKFTLLVVDPDVFSRVDFLVDGDLVYSDEEEPFEYAFHTDSFGLGAHTFQVMAYAADGEPAASREISREVVSAEEGWGTAAAIAVPIIGFSLLLTLISVVGPFFFGGKKKGFEPGKYGTMGGAVCPRCGLPFPRPFLAPNLVVGKLVHCPHCGKVALLPAAGREALEAAEERFRRQGQEGVFDARSAEDSLRRQIDDSRFES
jgi:hypothetical protein